jgi:hypothetical protein
MNSIVSGSTPAVVSRQWSDEPDGPNDKQVDIWWNGNWVPAYMKDIKAGDFYLILGVTLEPTQCFYAASDCVRYVSRGRWGAEDSAPNFMIKNGTEIVQAPAIKDIPAIETERKLLK